MRTITSKVSGTSFLSLLLMLACCGLLVGESADPDCAGLTRFACIHASLGGQRPLVREVELPMAAAAYSLRAVGRADPLFAEVWTHRPTQKHNSLRDRTPLTTPGDEAALVATTAAIRAADFETANQSPKPVSDLIAMLELPRPKPLLPAPRREKSPKAMRTAVAPPTVAAQSGSGDDVQGPQKKKKKVKRKRLKPPEGEVALGAAKEIPQRRNFSRQDAERLNNAAWTPDW